MFSPWKTQLPPDSVYEKVAGLGMFMSLERTFLQKWKDFFKKVICWSKFVTFVCTLFQLQYEISR